jgi:hypothetical protein
MPNVFLAPGSAARIQKSIKEGISLEEINPKEQNLIKLIGKISPPIKMWGVKQSAKNIGIWKDVKEGDIILFYSGGKFIFRGDVAFTYPLKESEEQLNEARRIAEIVWGRDARNRETWPYLIFLSKAEEVDIPLDQLNRAAGYNEEYVVRGFTKVKNPEGVLGFLGEKQKEEVVQSKHDIAAKLLGNIKNLEQSIEELLEPAKPSFPITHECAEMLLLEIGRLLGFEVYTADSSKECNGIRLEDLASMNKDELSGDIGKEILDPLSRVDVLWKSKIGFYAFEVVISGNIQEALLKFSKIRALIHTMFVVAEENKRYKYEEEIKSPAFDIIREECRFISLSQLVKMYVLTKLWKSVAKEFRLEKLQPRMRARG